jgi:hypothetical protein
VVAALAELEEGVERLAKDQPETIALVLSEIAKLRSQIQQLKERCNLPVEHRDGVDGADLAAKATTERFWLTPPEVYEDLSRQYGPFDFDPCPHPRPEGYDSLRIPWGRCNYVNPPFHQHDGVDGQGPTAFVRKAIGEQKQGKTSVLTLPVQSYVDLLLEAGAELQSLGRVRWRESRRGEPMPGPSPCLLLRFARFSEVLSHPSVAGFHPHADKQKRTRICPANGGNSRKPPSRVTTFPELVTDPVPRGSDRPNTTFLPR